MGEIESKVFEKMSKDNFQRWVVPLVDDLILRAGKKPRRILDVGSGPGLLVKEIAQRFKGSEVMGIDNSQVAVRLARKNSKKQKNIRFIAAEAEKLPFKDQSFDIIVSKDSLHHFANVKKCLKEMMRVLKKQGILYIQDLRRDLPMHMLKQAMPPDTIIKKLQYYSARASYTKDELKNILRELGLKQFKITTRKADFRLIRKYQKLGVEPLKLKQSFVTRYVAIVTKDK